MATPRYWVTGGNGNTNSTTNWSASSGGASGASVPTAGFSAIFDGNSGTGTVTINAALAVHDFDASAAGALTFAGASGLTVGGQGTDTTAAVFKLASGQTWSATSNITFDNRSAGLTVTTAGVSLSTSGTITAGANASGGVTFADSCNMGASNFTINRGAITVSSGTTLTCAILTTAGAGVKSIVYSGASISVISWAMGGTLGNLTITGNSGSSLSLSGSGTFTGGAKSYPGTVTFTAADGLATVSDSGNTFVNFTWTGSTARSSLDVNNFTVSGVLTLTGLSQIGYGCIESGTDSNSTQVTVTCNGSFSLTNMNFRGIVAAGTAGTWTGTNMGDRGNNSNITFDAPKNRYYVGGAANFFSGNKWSATSGGSTGASAPLPQDTAVFDNTGVTSNSITVTNDGSYWPVIDTTALTRTGFVLTVSGAKVAVIQACGNISLGTTTQLNMQNGAGNSVQWYKPSATITVSMGVGSFISCTSNTPHRIYSTVATSGIFSFTTSPIQLLGGTFDCSSASCTMGGIQDSSANGTVNFGTCIHYLNGTGANLFNLNVGASTAVNGANTSEFVLVDTSASTRTVTLTKNAGASALTLKSLSYPSGTGALITAGSGIINVLALGSGTTWTATSGTTVTLGALDAIGRPSNISIRSVTAASAFTISKPSGIINLDYITMQDCTASGGATFYAGANSTNTSGNTGWSFTSGPARQRSPLLGAA